MATIAGYTPKLCGWLAGGAAAVALLLAAPLPARAADYDTTLAQLDELQTLAETYVQEQDSGADRCCWPFPTPAAALTTIRFAADSRHARCFI